MPDDRMLRQVVFGIMEGETIEKNGVTIIYTVHDSTRWRQIARMVSYSRHIEMKLDDDDRTLQTNRYMQWSLQTQIAVKKQKQLYVFMYKLVHSAGAVSHCCFFSIFSHAHCKTASYCTFRFVASCLRESKTVYRD